MSTDTGSGMSTVFVIPHKGRPEMLVDTLHSIRKQEGFKGKICVVVVTKEPALRISQNWLSPEGNKVPVKIITVPDEYTISAQRNTGVKAIKSTHVAFIDADVDLSNNWLLCMQSLLNDSAERIMVSSVQICDDDAPMVERIRTSQANVSGDARPAHLPGANLFARRADVVRVGGFPEHLSTCEDYYFSVEMAKHGELYTTSQADFIHLGEDKNLWTLFVKEIWRGASNLDSIEGREIPRSEWPSFIVPAWSLFWTLIFWISLFNGWLSLFLLSAIAIIVPSVLYAFRLKKKTDCDVIFAFVVLHYMVYFVARGVGMLKSGSRIFAKFALRKIKAKLADRSGKKSNFSSSAAGTVALNSNPVADNAGKNAQQRTRAQSNASASASGGPTSGTAKATAPVGKRASNTQTGAPLRVMQFICSTGFYGAEGWILALANNTDRKDVEHHLAVSREPENKDLELTRRYRKLGLPAHEIPMSSRFDVSVIKKLIKLIKDNQIDVIHTHGYKSDILGVIAAKLAGISCVSTPHGFENVTDWKLKLYIRLGNMSFKRFDAVAPLSKGLLWDIRQMGVKEEKISYIPNGVDLKPIIAGLKRAPMSSKKSGNAPPVMGYIGQLIDRKNVDDIITAYVILQKRYPNLRLMIVGEGENRAALQAKVAKLDCASQVEFSGFVNDPLARLRQFDMFVMTSSLEGIPRCLMESMAMGVPVVAYNIPGVDQLIVHKETGLLAPLGEVQKLTKQCDALLRSAQLAETLRVNARKHVIGQFSAQRMAKQYLGLYQKLVVDR